MLHMLMLKSPENARFKFVLVNSVWNGVKVVCAVFRCHVHFLDVILRRFSFSASWNPGVFGVPEKKNAQRSSPYCMYIK